MPHTSNKNWKFSSVEFQTQKDGKAVHKKHKSKNKVNMMYKTYINSFQPSLSGTTNRNDPNQRSTNTVPSPTANLKKINTSRSNSTINSSNNNSNGRSTSDRMTKVPSSADLESLYESMFVALYGPEYQPIRDKQRMRSQIHITRSSIPIRDILNE